MKLSDSLDLKGKLTIQKISINNKIDNEIVAHNDITLSGRKLVAQLFSSNAQAKPVDQIKLGTGTKEFDAKDNDLAKPIKDNSTPSKDHSITIETREITETDDNRIKLILTGTLKEEDSAVNGKKLREACLYSSDSQVMYNRVQFPPISKTENFKLTLIWEIIF